MAKAHKIKISERALLQRINRTLSERDEVLKKARSERVSDDLGRYFVLDTRLNAVVRKDVELEGYGRSLKALKDYEVLEGKANG
jgi:hypothetical protein